MQLLGKFSSQSPQPTSSTSSKSWTRANKLRVVNKLLCVLVLAVTLAIMSSSSNMLGVSAMVRCPPRCTGTDCPPEVTSENCPYGIVRDYCGRNVCAKGPGQVCGVGMFKMLGICGDGMFCKCGRCIGCSLDTLECYDKTCT